MSVRDFPKQLGPGAPVYPPAPPEFHLLCRRYAGRSLCHRTLHTETRFGIDFLLKMWDDKSETLLLSGGKRWDWDNFDYLSDYDIWRLPQADDDWTGCRKTGAFICHRPGFPSWSRRFKDQSPTWLGAWLPISLFVIKNSRTSVFETG